jgi:hypothetical protein
LSTSETSASDFDAWIVEEFAATGPFTALVILVEIGEHTVTPVTSTYFNVIGDEIEWQEIASLFAGSGVGWDAASFFPNVAPNGGPLDNDAARSELRALETRVKEERLALNEGFFFDQHGRRMMVEQVPPQ